MSATASPKPPATAVKLGPIPKGIALAIAAVLVIFGGKAGIMILLAFLGVPLFALMGSGAALGWLSIDANLPPGAEHVHEVVRFVAADVLQPEFAGSPILVTIPLFTFIGYLMAESKTPQRIVRASRAFFGWMPGGLAVVCICASAFFTTLTGASGVTIVAIGGLLYPALRQQKYPDSFSLGLVTAGGSLGLLLPPSLPILVYSLVAFIPKEQTFIAGLMPGLLVMVILAGYSAYIAIKSKIPTEPLNLREMGASLWLIKWELLVPVIILGGLATGFTQLDESAAITALYTLIIEVFVYKDLSIKKDLPRIAKNSMSLAGAVILILAMANSLIDYVKSWPWPLAEKGAVNGVGIPEYILAWLSHHTSLDTTWKFLIGLNVFLLIVGMLMDGFSAILVSVPLIVPIAAQFRMNPFHLAMIFLLNLELAYVCPPLGLNLYIASFRFERPVVSLYKIVLPFVGLLLIALGLVTYVPRISTFLLEGKVEEMRQKDLHDLDTCDPPSFEYDKLMCVQSSPTKQHPCNARGELMHCLGAKSDGSQDEDYAEYCVKAYEKSCVQRAWPNDEYAAEACGGKSWKEQWADKKARCDVKNGIKPAPTASAAPSSSGPLDPDEQLLKDLEGPSGATSGSAAPGGAPMDPDEQLLKDMEGPSGATSGSASPKPSATAPIDPDEQLLKDMEGN